MLICADGKAALALLLPMMSAYLLHACETREAAEEDPVAKSCKDRLLTYMSSKRKPAGAFLPLVKPQLCVVSYA